MVAWPVSNEVPAGRTAPAAAPADAPGTGWRPGAALSGLVGVVALGLTLGVAELLCRGGQLVGWLGPASSPLGALGQTFISLTPEWLKQFAISTFGTNDKAALLAGMGLTMLVAGAVVGVIARDRPRVAVGVAGLLVVVTAVAILTRTDSSPFDLLPLLAGAVAGLWFLVAAFRRQLGPGPAAAATGSSTPSTLSAPALPVTGSSAVSAVDPAPGSADAHPSGDAKPGLSGAGHRWPGPRARRPPPGGTSCGSPASGRCWPWPPARWPAGYRAPPTWPPTGERWRCPPRPRRRRRSPGRPWTTSPASPRSSPRTPTSTGSTPPSWCRG